MWRDLTVGGRTSTAQAINLLSDALEELSSGSNRRGLPPVCILMSDGYHTDGDREYAEAIGRLDGIPWGKHAVRLSIGIGQRGDYSEPALLQFANQSDVGLLEAHNPHELVHWIRWASVQVTSAVSSGKTKPEGGAGFQREEPDAPSEDDDPDDFKPF